MFILYFWMLSCCTIFWVAITGLAFADSVPDKYEWEFRCVCDKLIRFSLFGIILGPIVGLWIILLDGGNFRL